MQDVFLTLWRDPALFDPARGSLAGYVAMMARSRAVDRVRSLTAGSAAVERLGVRDEARPRRRGRPGDAVVRHDERGPRAGRGGGAAGRAARRAFSGLRQGLSAAEIAAGRRRAARHGQEPAAPGPPEHPRGPGPPDASALGHSRLDPDEPILSTLGSRSDRAQRQATSTTVDAAPDQPRARDRAVGPRALLMQAAHPLAVARAARPTPARSTSPTTAWHGPRR